MIKFNGDFFNDVNLFSKDSSFLYKYTSDLLLKLVPNSFNYYNSLSSSLRLCDDCNRPVKVFFVDSSVLVERGLENGCAIFIPLLNDYINIGDSSMFNNLNTLDLLLLLRRLMTGLRRFHNNGVFHGDISGANILFNSDSEYRFIDFDQGVVNDNVSNWNVYIDDFTDVDDIIEATMKTDKIDLLLMFLKRFLGISVFDDFSESRLKFLLFPTDINDLIFNYISTRNIPFDYYFDDVIDYLISIKYESPFMKIKKMM